MAIDRTRYPGIPEDFPIEEVVGALPGAQLKLLMVEEDGHYYPTGTSPTEVKEALDVCEDLVLQVRTYCVNEASQGSTQDSILTHVYRYLLQKNWCHPSQLRWVCLKVAKVLEWSIPLELQVDSMRPAEESGGAV